MLLAAAAPDGAGATEPCLPADRTWFLENVARPSDLVVHGVVEDQSGRVSRWLGRVWTKVRVIETLKGEAPRRGVVTVTGWQAHDPPFHDFGTGDHLVLWLTTEGPARRLTDDAWALCVPSLWPAFPDGTVYSPLTNARAPLSHVKALLEETRRE